MSPDARLWIEALPRRWARNGIFAGIFCAHARFEVNSDAGDVVYVVAFSCVLAGLLSLIGAVIGRRTRAELRRLYDVPDDDRAAAIARLPAQFAIRAAVALFIIAFAVVPVFYLLIPAPTDAGRDNLALLGVLAVCLVAGPAIGFFAGACLRANLRMRLALTPAPSAPQGDAAALPVAVRSGRQTSRNYIARHWRGELSLAVSYWGNTALISITIVLAVAAIMANVDLLSLEPLVYPGYLIAFLQ